MWRHVAIIAPPNSFAYGKVVYSARLPLQHLKQSWWDENCSRAECIYTLLKQTIHVYMYLAVLSKSQGSWSCYFNHDYWFKPRLLVAISFSVCDSVVHVHVYLHCRMSECLLSKCPLPLLPYCTLSCTLLIWKAHTLLVLSVKLLLKHLGTQHYELKVSVQTLYVPQHNRNTDQYGSRHLSHVANDDLAVNNY